MPVEVNITDLPNHLLTWFVVGDVLAGALYFMQQPNVGYWELAFDIVLDELGYVGSGNVKIYS